MAGTGDRIVIVGGGIAGLATALHLAPMPVTLIAGGGLGGECSTRLAQGGVAAAMGPDDSAALHAADTLEAAAGLGDAAVAERVTRAAPIAIDWLIRLGVQFDRDAAGAALVLGLEAAHGRRRILHAGGDRTGQRILDTLVDAVRAAPSISVLENVWADSLALGTSGEVVGVHLRQAEVAFHTGSVFYPARAVVLSTGGIGGLYGATTNPLGSTGSGLLLAARAGAVLRDLEFVQFHPTAISVGRDPMPLATEALRGEGACLINGAGEPVMADVPGADLAPRDIVAATLFARIARGEDVFLELPEDLARGLAHRFPGVAALCAANGVDLARRRIPVRPAAHYHMGGVRVAGNGRTSVAGLWACGEVASTGLHGANRLASNSLVEALVYARWIAEDLQSAAAGSKPPKVVPPSHRGGATGHAAPWLRALMDRCVGVARDDAGLREAVCDLASAAFGRDGDDHTLTALLIAVSALNRRESRGAHRRHPQTSAEGRSSEWTLAEVRAQVLELTSGEPALQEAS
ncbi:MAG: L-aspartate oxidase [Devosia nanyangense]|uniref:L-aspartate oxidase n=1 Tax=Devosia nanyangense TaxID=1228055 RepID=A0A933KZ70_9HYPH|nr:L-aspartate oxidase [Devosia nanyangense]